MLAERGIKIFPVIGNHEYRGFTRTPLAKLFSRFEHLGRRNYYSVGIGGLLVVCLDSNASRMSAEAIEAQDRWLDDVLSKATADPSIWLVLPILHHPPFTNVSPRYLVFESAEVQQRFVPRFLACGKIAAVIAGHVHTYERLLHEGVQFIVTGGGGSPRFKLKPETGRKHARICCLQRARPAVPLLATSSRRRAPQARGRDAVPVRGRPVDRRRSLRARLARMTDLPTPPCNADRALERSPCRAEGSTGCLAVGVGEGAPRP